MNYYNENDRFAVRWLANLMADGLIPKGEIDARSILDVHVPPLAAEFVRAFLDISVDTRVDTR